MLLLNHDLTSTIRKNLGQKAFQFLIHEINTKKKRNVKMLFIDFFRPTDFVFFNTAENF